MDLARRLGETIRAHDAAPCVIGVLNGRAIVGMTDEELGHLIDLDPPKLNSSNLGMALHRPGGAGATTVSATMECAAAAGVRVFASGGLGGIHAGPFDVSADLIALTRFPVAVVCSGVKSILDVVATREALETLGVPVVGFGTDEFPAFYTRRSGVGVDWRIDDVEELSATVSSEINRTGRGVVVANPISEDDAIPEEDLERWIREANVDVHEKSPRDRTPHVLARLHDLSGGATLVANIALVLSNADLAARLASSWTSEPSRADSLS